MWLHPIYNCVSQTCESHFILACKHWSISKKPLHNRSWYLLPMNQLPVEWSKQVFYEPPTTFSVLCSCLTCLKHAAAITFRMSTYLHKVIKFNEVKKKKKSQFFCVLFVSWLPLITSGRKRAQMSRSVVKSIIQPDILIGLIFFLCIHLNLPVDLCVRFKDRYKVKSALLLSSAVIYCISCVVIGFMRTVSLLLMRLWSLKIKVLREWIEWLFLIHNWSMTATWSSYLKVNLTVFSSVKLFSLADVLCHRTGMIIQARKCSVKYNRSQAAF